MAKPRVFLSSTFYDLRYARVSLKSFIRDMGYEPVLNERGNIPFSNDRQLQDYCYSEINKVNILVSIIGGRFGSTSNVDDRRSVSNVELQTAIKLGKQVYIFIDGNVNAEYFLYVKNKHRDVEYHHVDDRRVHEFIDEIYGLSKNNQIFAFTEIPQIIGYLKEQWAGLFENLLEQGNQEVVSQSISRLEATAQTLNGLVALFKNQEIGLSTTAQDCELALNSVVLQNHPIFNALRKDLKARYRVFFTNITEFKEWLAGSRNGRPDGEVTVDDVDYHQYRYSVQKIDYILLLAKSLFDAYDNLKVMLPAEWEDRFVIHNVVSSSDLDEDIPF